MSVLPQENMSPGAAPENKKEVKKKSVRKEILSWVLTLAAAVAIALLVRTFLFEPIRVDGESMTDTLQNGELMFVTKPEYILGSPSRQDVIICRYPNRKEYFVKRLVALPGDTVEIKYDKDSGTNTVYVNGKAVDEPYLTPSRNDKDNSMSPLTLKNDEYFVLGDNRDNSNDSRYVGALHRSQIVGHVRFVFFPFSDAHSIS
jgi:signal peptidase I